MTDERELDELDLDVTNTAVAALKSALTKARAQAESEGKVRLAGSVDRLAECTMVVTAVRARVTVELFAPGEDGGTVRFFSITANEEVLH